MKIDIKRILPFMILVTAIFSGVMVEWTFDKDWTTLSRDGDIIAKSKWVIQSERTYINKNSAYRNNVMCPRIIDNGGYETATRCYYAPDTYELLKRSLLKTKITEQDNKILKSVPFYAYGSRGSYAGFIKELTVFSDKATNIEEFPESFMVTWEPKDTRNYKLIWRLEKLDTSDYRSGHYTDCSYNFGNVKIDLKDECEKLDYVNIENSKATVYFKPTRFNQILDIGFVDPATMAYITPTPVDNANISVDNALINISIDESDLQTLDFDWEYTGSDDNLVGFWKFDESSGTNAEDSSDAGNNGTLTNMNTGLDNCTGNCSGWTTGGKKKNGIDFDGVNDYVKVDDSASIDVSTAFTMSAWIKTTELNDGYHRILHKNGAYSFVINNLGSKLGIYNWADTQWITSDADVLSTDTWHHAVVVFDGVDKQFYVDGVDAGSTADSTAFNINALDLYIGLDEDLSSFPFNGTIDHVKIYNTAHTAEQVWDEYMSTRPRFYEDSLVLAMNFDNNSDLGETNALAVDNTNVNNGTITNAVWTADGKYGGAMEFDGDGDYISFSASADTTVTYWKKNITDSDWIYIVNSSGTVYVDGSIGNIESIFVNKTRIGINSSGGYFNGTIDEVRIYNRALSADEIKWHYDSNLKKYNDTYWVLSANATNKSDGSYDYHSWANDTSGNEGTTSVRTVNIGIVPDDGTIWIYPKDNYETSIWMLDFGLTGGSVGNYSDSCGTITTANTDTVNTFKNGSYALSINGERSPLGNSEKLKFGMLNFPIRYDSDSYRIFFQVTDNLTADTVTQINLNVSEVMNRTGIITSIDVDTYTLYRINYFGGVYNDTGLCYEQPVKVGN